MTLQEVENRIKEIKNKWPSTNLSCFRVLVKPKPIPTLIAMDGYVDKDLYDISDIILLTPDQ